MRRLMLFVTLFLFLVSYAQKPNVYILATGGTIAGVGESSVNTSYKAGEVAISSLLDAVPQVKDVANVVGEQVVRIGSQDMDDSTWLLLSKRINELLNSDEADAVVVTHGTDTMEETAFFLSLTTRSNKPVVLVGAMRPSTALSADGPLNLYNAVVTAASPDSRDRGVLVVMNGSIYAASDVIKMHTTHVDAFRSANGAAVGYVNNDKAVYSYPAVETAASLLFFDVSKLTSLPAVGIIYGHAGVRGNVVQSMIDNGYKGIVYAGVGNGNIHRDIFPVLEEARSEGIIVVRSSRVPSGPTMLDNEVDDAHYRFVASQLLTPQKSRILLQLALTKTDDWIRIQDYFNIFR